MIVYHLTTQDKLAKFLRDGVKRRDGRHYVFQKWTDVQRVLLALAEESQSISQYSKNVVLVLDVDEDNLIQSPIPKRQLSRNISLVEIEKLQSYSYYLEIDVTPGQIVAVKNALGSDVSTNIQTSNKSLNALWRFLAYVKPYAHLVFFSTLCGTIKFTIPLAFPWILRTVIDDIILNQSVAIADKTTEVLKLIILAFVLNIIWLALTYGRNLFIARAGHSMIKDLRVALYNHVQRLSHQFFACHPSSTIVGRVVHDIATAQNFVGAALTNLWMDLIFLFILFGLLVSISSTLSIVAVCLLPLFALSIVFVGKYIRQNSRELQQRVEIITGGLHEKVAGVSIVKGFTRESAESKAFAGQADKLLSKTLHSVRFTTLNEMIVGFVVMTSPVLVLWIGSKQIISGQLTIGELTQFLLYLGLFYGPIQRLSDLNVVVSNSMAAINRVFEFFDMQPQVTERAGALRLNSCKGEVIFDNVSFGYEKESFSLKIISLTINPGETVALVGPSGSGKSTLANLIPRFYDPTSGIITLDSYNLRDLNLESLRMHIGIVSQETVLFSGTVRENLLMAKPDATSEELISALTAANAQDFVDELPDGLWTELGERGYRLSGGQRQRLAIARAFLKNPKILILDEATSSLDSRSENLIQEALSKLLQSRTAIVIAHRLSTILGADKIAVLNRGRIVELGAHIELLQNSGLYAELFKEQFKQN